MFWQLYINPLFQLSNIFWLQIWTTVIAWCRLGTGDVLHLSTAWWSHFRDDQYVLIWASLSTPLHICAPSTHVVLMSWLLELYCHHLAHQPISAGLVGRNTHQTSFDHQWLAQGRDIRIQLHSTSKRTHKTIGNAIQWMRCVGNSEAYPNSIGWEDLFPIDQEDTQCSSM